MLLEQNPVDKNIAKITENPECKIREGTFVPERVGTSP
jgi:hypothetical protein